MALLPYYSTGTLGTLKSPEGGVGRPLQRQYVQRPSEAHLEQSCSTRAGSGEASHELVHQQQQVFACCAARARAGRARANHMHAACITILRGRGIAPRPAHLNFWRRVQRKLNGVLDGIIQLHGAKKTNFVSMSNARANESCTDGLVLFRNVELSNIVLPIQRIQRTQLFILMPFLSALSSTATHGVLCKFGHFRTASTAVHNIL